MKIRRIPETDLARIAVLTEAEQRAELRLLKEFRPPYSLQPFREIVGDLVNLQVGMFSGGATTPWSQVESTLTHRCKTAVELQRNLAVAKALYGFAIEHEVVSYDRPSSRWAVGFEHSVAYWNNFYSVYGERVHFFHFDPRRTHPLTLEARRFALSMMHQRLRVEDPDFAEAELAVVRFGERTNGERFVRLYTATDVELFNYDQLTAMVDTTYNLWIRELQRRQDDARRAGGGTGKLP